MSTSNYIWDIADYDYDKHDHDKDKIEIKFIQKTNEFPLLNFWITKHTFYKYGRMSNTKKENSQHTKSHLIF